MLDIAAQLCVGVDWMPIHMANLTEMHLCICSTLITPSPATLEFCNFLLNWCIQNENHHPMSQQNQGTKADRGNRRPTERHGEEKGALIVPGCRNDVNESMHAERSE